MEVLRCVRHHHPGMNEAQPGWSGSVGHQRRGVRRMIPSSISFRRNPSSPPNMATTSLISASVTGRSSGSSDTIFSFGTCPAGDVARRRRCGLSSVLGSSMPPNVATQIEGVHRGHPDHQLGQPCQGGRAATTRSALDHHRSGWSARSGAGLYLETDGCCYRSAGCGNDGRRPTSGYCRE